MNGWMYGPSQRRERAGAVAGHEGHAVQQRIMDLDGRGCVDGRDGLDAWRRGCVDDGD
jgi:hypothetical protein